jgi:nicotinamide phosphoribosyltransferase
MSNVLWLASTSATTAKAFRSTFDEYANVTDPGSEFVPWQGHDFSMRGMTGIEAAMLSGAAHLLSFTGTDTIPAIDFLERYYGANAETELVGGSVPATEHSVMSMGGDADEQGTFNRLLSDVYPGGILSVVSDTWDFWKVVTEYVPNLRDTILARDGKLVIRPDSGDPVLIVCGDPNATPGTPEHKGAIECLWDTFGGDLSPTGFRRLDPHIGLIYGDGISLERQRNILEGLKQKSFASTNIVLGIGSYTYQYVTRDTDGWAMKATAGMTTSGGLMEIFKDPKTDDGAKKSARGLLKVEKIDGRYTLMDQVSEEEEMTGALTPVFLDGRMTRFQTLAEIREVVSCS